MPSDNLFSANLNEIETDFRAEVIAAELIENDTLQDQILIVPLGAMSRPYRKDVQSIEEEVSNIDNTEYILIRTHREGLYDKLPEGLFHEAISYAKNKTEAQVIEAIKQHRQEEKAARKFFLPFDAALYNLRMQITLYENQLDKKFHSGQLVKIFSAHWEIFQYLNVLQANIFLQFLPVIHRIRDDWPAIEVLFDLMFSTPAKLTSRNHREEFRSEQQGAKHSGLGHSMLGVDFTTGDYVEGGEFVEMVITLGPLSAEQVSQFTGKEQQEKVLLMLCDYVLPADMDIVIEYDFTKADRSFSLNEKGAIGNNCTMGISAYL